MMEMNRRIRNEIKSHAGNKFLGYSFFPLWLNSTGFYPSVMRKMRMRIPMAMSLSVTDLRAQLLMRIEE